ncbi:MFS transporter [Amycolatopsis sp. NPDC049691]|uniref:MFS transporter n=1 Tax=Amycolatopsis sp. NPDC049691 TaxID=3155155 RepID=UPI00343DB9FE
MSTRQAQPGSSLRGESRQRRRALALLAVATAIGSTGLAAGGTAGALLAVDITKAPAMAGVPLGLLVLGSAAGAPLLARQAAIGRRVRGLALGYALGVAGAVLVVLAAQWQSLALLLAGSFVLGVANSAVFMSRYAAMDTATTGNRGRAIGVVFAATALGAVVSPTLLGPSGSVARALGLPPLAGLYLAAVLAFGLAAVLLATRSRALGPRPEPGPGVVAVLADTVRRREAVTAVGVLAATNFVMVGVMTIAPVHLTEHGHSLDQVGVVVALHVIGMFAVAPLTGLLADRKGPAAVARLGGVLLTVAMVIGLFVGHSGTLVMTVHLLVLGVGWNCGVVGGSTLLGAAVPAGTRPHVEGIAEVMMGLAAAAAGPISGLVADFGGYLVFCVIGTPAAVFLFLRRIPS